MHAIILPNVSDTSVEFIRFALVFLSFYSSETQSMASRWTSCIVIGLSALTLGCGGKPTKREPVFAIKGTVTYKGQPVVAADVIFVCAEKKRSAFGRTDEKGFYKLTTFVPNDGAVAGKHVVTVVKIEASAPAEKEPDLHDAGYDPGKVAAPPKSAAKKNQIPAKYSDINSSDLFVTVTPDTNPDVPLELKD